MGASPWYSASSRLPRLWFFGACILLGVCQCRMGHPPRNSLQPQEPHRSDRDSEMHISVAPKGGFQEIWEGQDPQREPCAPHPRGKWLWWQQPGRLNTTAVPWQGHRTWDLLGGKLILGALRRGYFGPFALCESPAIFQPHWGYFRGSDLHGLGQCCWHSPGVLEPKAMLGAQLTPQTGCREVSRLPAGAPSNSCSARDAHSRVDPPRAHPITLPPSQRTAWLGLEFLIPLHCF